MTRHIKLRKHWSENLLVAVPFILGVFSAIRVWEVLPTVMQDEYIYSSQARNQTFEDQRFSNYFYSLVMRLTLLCGDDFYTCTKGINTAMFLLNIALILLMALRFLNWRESIFVASVTALSPIALPVSYFMPETMYFLGMTLTILLTLFATKYSHWTWWLIPGFSLGVAALIKPHAIFLLPAFAVFALLFCYKQSNSSWLRGVLASGSLSLGFAVSKFGLGFIFAGTKGLSLLGGYSSSASVIESPASNGSSGVVENGESGLETLVNVALSHFAAHGAVVLLLAGIPLLLSFRVIYWVLKTKQPISEASGLFVLVSIITLSMLGLVSIFEGYVTASGDDHSDRLILRYYEFLIPQFLMLSFLIAKYEQSKISRRILQGGLIVLSTVALAANYPSIINHQFADSSTLPALGADQAVFGLTAAIVSLTTVFWIANPAGGGWLFSRIVLPFILVLALVLSQNKLIQMNGNAAYFDRAGWDSRSYLEGIPGDRILVIGQTRTEVFTVKFWIDEASIRDLLVVEGSAIPSERVEDVEYVVALGDIQFDFEHQLVTKGQGYKLVKVVR